MVARRAKRGEQFDRTVAEMRREHAERELAAGADRALTPAEHQQRYRARLRGEDVPARKPGPKSREDRLRAALLEAQAENAGLRERVAELEEALERRRRPPA
jgi:hypothetical protein